MSTVLVTGGAGYIGSHVAVELLERGHQPVVYDNLSTGHEWAVLGGEFVRGDLGDREALYSVLRSYPIDAVMHFAGHASVSESMEQAARYFRNNVANTINLLDLMVSCGVTYVIFSSSCAVYGHPHTIPIPEEHPKEPMSPYGESKLLVERALPWYERIHGLRFMALRYFNAAGADGRIGEVHDPEPHLIPRTLLAALGRIPFVEIFGMDYPTYDGTCIRDYIHVMDLAEAHLLALEYLLSEGESGAFNLGIERGYSVREVIRAAEEVTGRAIPVKEASRRPGDPPELVARAAKARQVLGWEPKVDDLDGIIRSAWEFFLRHEGRLKRA